MLETLRSWQIISIYCTWKLLLYRYDFRPPIMVGGDFGFLFARFRLESLRAGTQ